MSHEMPSAGMLSVFVSLSVVSTALAGTPSFSNQTGNAGVAVVHVTGGFSQAQYSGGGTIGDFNGDGWQDFFVCSGGNNSTIDHLFINNGDGTFTDEGEDWGLLAHKGKGSAVADINADGLLDLFVTSAGPPGGGSAPGHHKLYINNGDGTFAERATLAGVDVTNPSDEDGWGATFGDYDLDGDLDLFVGGFFNSNQGSRLFQNNGNGVFDDVTADISLFQGVSSMACLSPGLVDMDNDWYPDLLMVSDFGTSHYFKNNGDGTFSDWTTESQSSEEENGMGQTLGDFNNDGLLDWYVTSIYFPSIGWTGNKLYRNQGGHVLHDYSNNAGVEDGGYGWGAAAVDFNHDGLLDIAETNGDGSGGGSFFQEQSYLFMADSINSYTEMAVSSGLAHFGKGRGMVHFDYDNDGDQDLLIFANNEILSLFRNDLDLEAGDTHWLRVFLDTSDAEDLPPNGYGARVHATVGETTMMRSIDGANTFLGIDELSAHFGLGAAIVIDELRVAWPDGTETILTDVDADQTMTVQAGVFCPADVDGDGEVTVSDLITVILEWGDCDGCDGDVDGNGVVDVLDLVAVILGWGEC